MQATLDDGARASSASTLNETVTGPVPFRLQRPCLLRPTRRAAIRSRPTSGTPRSTNCCPAGAKAAGKPTKVTFTVVDKPQSMRFEEIVIEGAGRLVKGTIELDDKGEIMLANFPTFQLSDGDKATLQGRPRTGRHLKVTMRGDVFDGRGFVKSNTSAGPVVGAKIKQSDARPRPRRQDRRRRRLSTARRCAAWNCGCRAAPASVRTFGLNAKLGRDAALIGDLRGRIRAAARSCTSRATTPARCCVSPTPIRASSAGRCGSRSIRRTPTSTPQEGDAQRARLRGARRGRARTRRVSGERPDRTDAAGDRFGSFARMRVDFTRSPGKLAVRDGVVWGRRSARPSTARSTTRTTTCACAAPSCRSTRSTTCSARFPIVGIFLGGGRTRACSASPTRWSARRASRCCASTRSRRVRARPPAQDVRIPQRRHRRPQRGPAVFVFADPLELSARRSARPVQTGFSSTCLLRPSESLITPSGVRSLRRQDHLLVGHGRIVDPQSAALDLPARFAVRGDESRIHERRRARRGPSRSRRAAPRRSAGSRPARLPRRSCARCPRPVRRPRGHAAARSPRSPAPSWPR